ncbi:MAG TPA: hypothetical protein VMU04_22855 [Candidatus Acidoferrum sp.]|nr:hypothetical protein [Candidatus Acidoferrum sp.]
MKFNAVRVEQALGMLSNHLDLAGTPTVRLVICGGASLIAAGIVSRTTKDVDIVALRTADGTLVAPVPLPEFLVAAAGVVARDLGLEPNWLNNGPSSDEGGLFQMGLPGGVRRASDGAGLWTAIKGLFHWPARPDILQVVRRR